MTAAIAMAQRYAIAIRFADLGDWGTHALRSEYDPHVPQIRINARITTRLTGDAFDEFVALAVGHELYHHLERLGEVAKLENREARERAADRFARQLLRAR